LQNAGLVIDLVIPKLKKNMFAQTHENVITVPVDPQPELDLSCFLTTRNDSCLFTHNKKWFLILKSQTVTQS